MAASGLISLPMSIAENRRARYDYHIEERFEAGIVLEGWEIKAIRAGQVQLTDGYVVIRKPEELPRELPMLYAQLTS